MIDLSGIKPDAIFCSNDGIASGVIQALEEYGWAGSIPVTGLDAELLACKRVAKGTQAVTIFKSIKEQAFVAAEMAVQVANGKTPEKINTKIFNGSKEVLSFLIEPVAIDKINLNEVIIKGQVYTASAVYE